MKKLLIISLLSITPLYGMRRARATMAKAVGSRARALKPLTPGARLKVLPQENDPILALPSPDEIKSAKRHQMAMVLSQELNSFYSRELIRIVLLRDHLNELLKKLRNMASRESHLYLFFETYEEGTRQEVDYFIRQRKQIAAACKIDPEKALKIWARSVIKRRRIEQKAAEQEILTLKKFLYDEQ